ncbi:MAG: DUF2330 domain-containing protein [candidate division WOR-3 bacterium]
MAITRLSVALLICGGLASADGGLITGPDGWVHEYGQVAAISYFGGNEQLALVASYRAGADSFAWIIPLPSLPAVDTVPLGFFAELQDYSQPYYRSGDWFGCGGMEPMPDARFGDSLGVEEIAHGLVGMYEYEVLRVEIAESLVAYLARSGYVPRSDPTAVFQHYLDRGWNFFFVARVQDSLSETEGRAVGIRLAFASDSAVYPLYVSRLGSVYTGVVLYVLAEHRMHFAGAELWFSGRVEPATFYWDAGMVERPCRLTKLLKYYQPEQMQDIVLRRAPDDRDFRMVVSAGGNYGSLMPMLALAGLLLVRRRRAG